LILRAKRYIPGLIDAHIHMDLHGMANTYEENLVEDKLRAIRAVKEMQATLHSGITTVRNVGSVNHIDFAVKEAIESGLFEGPRILTSGKIISMTAAGNDYFLGMYREADGCDEVRKAAREQLKAGADFLKLMATGAYMNPGRRSRRAAAEPGRDGSRGRRSSQARPEGCCPRPRQAGDN
jgi:imidazolonepropionase-like amidohydrolase